MDQTRENGSSSVLEEDPIKLAGQKWALISVVGGDTSQKHVNGIHALKIRGVFETQEDANNHAKNLMRLDPHFDIYMVDLYRWLAIPPNRREVAEKCGEVYQEETLNDIIQDYKEQQRRVKMMYEERKQDMVQKAQQDNEARRKALEDLPEEESGFERIGSTSTPSAIMEDMMENSVSVPRANEEGESSKT